MGRRQIEDIHAAVNAGGRLKGELSYDTFLTIPGRRDYKFYFLIGYVAERVLIDPEYTAKYFDVLTNEDVYPVSDFINPVYAHLGNLFGSALPLQDSLLLICDNLVFEFDDIQFCCSAHFVSTLLESKRLQDEEVFWIASAFGVISKYRLFLHENEVDVKTLFS